MTTATTQETNPTSDKFHYHIVVTGDEGFGSDADSPPIAEYSRAVRLARALIEEEAALRDVESDGPVRRVEQTQLAPNGSIQFHGQTVAGFGFFTDDGNESVESRVIACQNVETMTADQKADAERETAKGIADLLGKILGVEVVDARRLDDSALGY